MTTTLSRPAPSLPLASPERRGGLWVWLSVILLVIGLAAGFLVGRVTMADPVMPSDLAGTEVTALLEDFMTAVNAGDEATLERLFAPDATFTDTTKSDGYVMEGNTRIAEAIASWHPLGFQISDPGTAIQNGAYVAQFHVSSVDPVMAVYMTDGELIQHMWIVRP